MTFYLKAVRNIEKFKTALDNCSGKISLITDEDDVFNLRSKLSQLISLNVILFEVTKLDDTQLIIEKEDDFKILKPYITGSIKKKM